MSLTAEAIDRIGELTKSAGQEVPTITNDAAVALPGTVDIHDLEKFMPGRRRFRGVMTTDNIDAFCQYTAAQSSAEVFVEADKMRATAFFNLGDDSNPGHGDHRAGIQLQATSPFRALKKVDGEAMNQRTLAEWIEDWRRYVSCFDHENEDLHTQKALAAVRKMTVETARKLESEEQNMGRQLSAMESIDVKSEGAQLGGLFFSCTPYTGFQLRCFTLPLSAITGGDSIKLKLRIQELEAIEEEIAEEFRHKISAALTGDSFKIWMGAFNL